MTKVKLRDLEADRLGYEFERKSKKNVFKLNQNELEWLNNNLDNYGRCLIFEATAHTNHSKQIFFKFVVV